MTCCAARSATRLLRRVRRREFDQVFIATPCASYSVAHRPQLRTRRQPDGLANAPPEWRAYLAKHNGLARWTAELIAAAHEAGAAWALENPADRGDRLSPAWWEKYADHAPIWLNEHIAAALEDDGRGEAHLRAVQLRRAVAEVHHDRALGGAARGDGAAGRHGLHTRRRAARAAAHGRDSEGRSRAAQAAAYPPRMNEFIAEAMAETLRRGRDVGAPRHKSRGQSGGHVTDGPGLFGLGGGGVRGRATHRPALRIAAQQAGGRGVGARARGAPGRLARTDCAVQAPRAQGAEGGRCRGEGRRRPSARGALRCG